MKIIGVGISAELEEDIADLWDQEYEIAFKAQQEERLIQEKVTVDTQAVADNVDAIAQAI